jgi:hypothetical protein
MLNPMHHVRRRIGDGPPQVDTAGNPVKRWTDYPVSTRHPGNDVAGGTAVVANRLSPALNVTSGQSYRLPDGVSLAGSEHT